MHPEKFKPLQRAALAPTTLVLAVLGIAALVDMQTGVHVFGSIASAQLRMFGQNPETTGTIRSLFGTFESVHAWATFVAKAVSAVCLGLTSLSVLHGLWSSLTGR